MDYVRVLKRLSLFLLSPLLFHLSVDIVVRLLVRARDKTGRIQTVSAKLIDMPDYVPRSRENSKKREKEAESRAVTQQHRPTCAKVRLLVY